MVCEVVRHVFLGVQAVSEVQPLYRDVHTLRSVKFGKWYSVKNIIVY